MIICICEGVSDRDVRAEARRGATSLAALQRSCGAGGDCGACRPSLRRVLRETKAARRETPGG